VIRSSITLYKKLLQVFCCACIYLPCPHCASLRAPLNQL